MKKIISIFTCVLLITVVFGQTVNAQSNVEETEFFQSIFGMEKKAAFASFLNLEENNPFWNLYDAYEIERKELGKKRIAALKEYVENYDQLNDEKYDEVVATMISLRKSTDKLTDTYYKKIKKVSGSKIAAQFFQLEAYFLSEIRTTIMEGIPYIGEFDN